MPNNVTSCGECTRFRAFIPSACAPRPFFLPIAPFPMVHAPPGYQIYSNAASYLNIVANDPYHPLHYMTYTNTREV